MISESGRQPEPDLRVERRSRFRNPAHFLRLLFQLTLLCCLLAPAHAQYGFEVWTVDNGMPENEIRGITQTPDGYLWIATFNGLARFDGVHLTVFNRETPGCFRISSAPCCRERAETCGSTASIVASSVITMAASAPTEGRADWRVTSMD